MLKIRAERVVDFIIVVVRSVNVGCFAAGLSRARSQIRLYVGCFSVRRNAPRGEADAVSRRRPHPARRRESIWGNSLAGERIISIDVAAVAMYPADLGLEDSVPESVRKKLSAKGHILKMGRA